VGKDVANEGPATVADVQRIVNELTHPSDRPSFAAPSLEGPSEESLRIVNYLQSWPTREQAEAAVPLLVKLSSVTLVVLTRLATVEIV